MAKVCPTCGGTRIGCPTCGLPPKRKLPKATVFDKLYGALFGAKYWEVQGIDISKWNGTMNFNITKTKCQYVIMRLGYGTQWKDASSDIFYANAKAADMPIGVYWYLNIGQDANLTAQSFAEEISTHRPDLDIVLDVEATTLNKTATLEWLKTCDTKLTQLTGKKATIYTSAGFWEGVAPSAYWVGRNLWVANWTSRDTPYMPAGWTSWIHWQWSADGNMKASEYGSVAGDPDMDLDRFNGTVAQFNARYGTHITQIGGGGGGGGGGTPPPPGGLPEYVTIIQNETAIHSEPSPMLNNIVGIAKINTKWYPEELVKGTYGQDWYKFGKGIYIKKIYTKAP